MQPKNHPTSDLKWKSSRVTDSEAEDVLNSGGGSRGRRILNDVCFEYYLASREAPHYIPDTTLVLLHGIFQYAQTLQPLAAAILRRAGIDIDMITLGYPASPCTLGSNEMAGSNARRALYSFLFGETFMRDKHPAPIILFLTYSNGGLVLKHSLMPEKDDNSGYPTSVAQAPSAVCDASAGGSGKPFSKGEQLAAATALIANLAVPHKGGKPLCRLLALMVYGLSWGAFGIRKRVTEVRNIFLGAKQPPDWSVGGTFGLQTGVNRIAYELGEPGDHTNRNAETRFIDTCTRLRHNGFAVPAIIEMTRTLDCIAAPRKPYDHRIRHYPRETWHRNVPGSHILQTFIGQSLLGHKAENIVTELMKEEIETLFPKLDSCSNTRNTGSPQPRSLLAIRAASRLMWYGSDIKDQLRVSELFGDAPLSPEPAPLSYPQLTAWRWTMKELETASSKHSSGFKLFVDGPAYVGKSRMLAAVARSCSAAWLSCTSQARRADAFPYAVFFFDFRLLRISEKSASTKDEMYVAIRDAHRSYCAERGIDYKHFVDDLEHLRTSRQQILILDGVDEFLSAHPQITPAVLARAIEHLCCQSASVDGVKRHHHVVIAMRAGSTESSKEFTRKCKAAIDAAFGQEFRRLAVRSLTDDEMLREAFDGDEDGASKFRQQVQLLPGPYDFASLAGSPAVASSLKRDPSRVGSFSSGASVIEFLLVERMREELRKLRGEPKARLGKYGESEESICFAILEIIARLHYGESLLQMSGSFSRATLIGLVADASKRWSDGLCKKNPALGAAVELLVADDPVSVEIVQLALRCACVSLGESRYYFSHDLFRAYLAARFYSNVLRSTDCRELGELGFSPMITILAGQIMGSWVVPTEYVREAVEKASETGNLFYVCNIVAAAVWNPSASILLDGRSALADALIRPRMSAFTRAFILNGLVYRAQVDAQRDGAWVADDGAVNLARKLVRKVYSGCTCPVLAPLASWTLVALGDPGTECSAINADKFGSGLADVAALYERKDTIQLWSLQKALCELVWMLSDSKQSMFRLVPSMHYLAILATLAAAGRASAEAQGTLEAFTVGSQRSHLAQERASALDHLSQRWPEDASTLRSKFDRCFETYKMYIGDIVAKIVTASSP